MCLLAELTYRCPLQCPYCSNPLELMRYRGELDTETWQRVLSEAAALGVIQVHFSGGEPLVRHDLCDLVQHARAVGLYTHLSTGGTLADESALTRLHAAGLDAIQISLLDAQAESNDWLAGRPSFDKKQRAVTIAKKLGFPVTLNVVLHRYNLEHIADILALASAWQVDRLELAHVQYTGWAFRNRAALLPTRDQLDRATVAVDAARTRFGSRPEILHVMPDYFQQYPKACLQGWGRVFLTVAPDGAVLPCQTAREIPGLAFANVRHARLEEIWFHDPTFQRFRGTDWLPEPCHGCERREVDFGGCRCQAFLLTGDVGATDPVCHLSPRHELIDLALREDRTESLAFRC
jgi:PqqA peptide cyclase